MTEPQPLHSDAESVAGGAGSWLLQPWPATHCLIFGFALLHLFIAASLPLILFETHYALYGAQLDWSYVDHPPLVGWIQALVQLFSSSDLAMRIAPIVMTTASEYLLAALALRLFPGESRWLGFASVLLLQGALIIHGSIAMAPEVPLLLAGLLVLWFTWNLLDDAWLGNWIGLGVALGLAGLAKYTAVTLALSVLLTLLLTGRWRLVLQPGAWLAVAIAALLVSPVLLWNWANDWISFTYQIGYQMESGPSVWSLGDALNMQLEQLGVYSPALYLGGVIGAVTSLRRNELGARTLLLFALPILLLFAYLAGVGRSSPHWTLLGWVFLTPLAARWIMQRWRTRAARYLVYGSGSISVLALLALVILPLPALPFPDYGHPLKRFLGWQDASARVEVLRREWLAEECSAEEWSVEECGELPVLLVHNWHYAGPLAWYGHPTVVQDTRGKESQYKHWYGAMAPGVRGILVLVSDKSEEPLPRAPGLQCREIEKLPVYRGSTLARMFYFYRCESPDLQK